ncbi:alkyl/aryl-sulfatase [Caballeronia sordidicola]|uniref:Linear primary-alkylsulfatase n=1 Tax=Caballeronia sordidicola TaxID=196367 RepID=A0A242M8M4_CABSO|nr:alkyl sulfatase dimerization domain-containing protein [Caballeronia sordidicola]OTP67619.1 alkyl sulfatase [Caballeronia sordidicola]
MKTTIITTPHRLTLTALAALSMLAAPFALAQQAAPVPAKDATAITRQDNLAVYKELPFADKTDFEDAQRGFMGTIPTGTFKADDGRTSWDLNKYNFLKGEAPDTVNPSLWRIAQLNMFNGLFKVTDRVYQVRGLDLANMTIVEGDTGVILIDVMVTREAARAALDLYFQHRPKKPVVAVIYTHSHADHYGGVRGVIDEADVKSGKVKVVAPAGFLQEAVAENIFAGNAMGRRSLYQYGALLPPSMRGQVDAGLGKTTSAGNLGLIPPSDTVEKTGDTRTIDGVQFEFQMAPGTEAPSEMLIYMPQFKVLDTAEDTTHTLHNLYTLRGAQVRDAANWWKTLNEAILRYGNRTDVVIAQHHWPTWGQQKIVNYMADQRDMFKYLHDQSLRLANSGYTMTEIAEQIQLPDSIGKKWYNRGYYGSVNHDAKAIYQRYLGWYDSNPANLHPYPPEEESKRFVDFMGGADAVMTKAKQSFDKGDYRWVATVMNKVVFADPSNKAARNLEADALEQLGYQTENPTWRNEYLMGAFELRNGVPKLKGVNTATPDAIAAMSPDLLLDYMGIRLNGPKADGKHTVINWDLGDGRKYGIELRNSVLIYTEGVTLANPDATLTMSKDDFAGLLMGGQQQQADASKVSGNGQKVTELFGMLDRFDPMFNIVTP